MSAAQQLTSAPAVPPTPSPLNTLIRSSAASAWAHTALTIVLFKLRLYYAKALSSHVNLSREKSAVIKAAESSKFERIVARRCHEEMQRNAQH